MLNKTRINGLFVKMCVKTIFIFPHLVSDLDLYSFDLEIALQVTRHIGNLPSKFERRTEFCF